MLHIFQLELLTQDFLQKYLSGKFRIIQFEQEFDTQINFLEPIIEFFTRNNNIKNQLDCNFFPKRDTFLQFLNIAYSQEQIDLNNILSFNRSDILYMADEHGMKIFTDRKQFNTTLPCDIDKESGYIDSDILMRTDIEQFLESVE